MRNLEVDQTSKLDCTIIDRNGKVKICRLPDYIPQLSEVDTSLFAVSICTVDGQRMHLGDSDIYYTMQSTSKERATIFRGTIFIRFYSIFTQFLQIFTKLHLFLNPSEALHIRNHSRSS